MAPSLVVCPGCACHVRANESACPLCSASLPRTPGASLPRTAAAIAMGLAAVAVVPGCGDDTGDTGDSSSTEISAEYGVGPTGGGGPGTGSSSGGTTTSSSSSGGSGGGGGATSAASGSGGSGGEVTADYGVGPTGGGSGG